MGNLNRYPHRTERSASSAEPTHPYPAISLTEEEANITNKTLRRPEPPIEVRAWIHFRNTSSEDYVFWVPATVEAYTSVAVFVRFTHPIGGLAVPGSGQEEVDSQICWIWASAVTRLKPKNLE